MRSYPSNNYLFKVNNGNTRKTCEIGSERGQNEVIVFIVEFEQAIVSWVNLNVYSSWLEFQVALRLEVNIILRSFTKYFF